MKINITSIGGFRYSIPGSARNRKPQGDSILVGDTYFKLKMTLMGGYRGRVLERIRYLLNAYSLQTHTRALYKPLKSDAPHFD